MTKEVDVMIWERHCKLQIIFCFFAEQLQIIIKHRKSCLCFNFCYIYSTISILKILSMDIVEHVAKLEMQTQLLHVSILLICLSIVIWEIDCTTPIGTPLVYLVFSVSIKILLHIKNLFKKKKKPLSRC